MVRKPYVALSLAFASMTMTACSDKGRTEAPPQEEEHVESQSERLATTTAEYNLGAAIDSEILGDWETEIWARVYRPATLDANKRYPLLVFLHGNHGTCSTGSNPHTEPTANAGDYAETGTCPAGMVPTVNHEGYGYIANDMAASGYIVVSINANRGINTRFGPDDDLSLILARGRLILKHLELLSQWDKGSSPTPPTLGVDLTGHIDFSHVGLLGHSRGGEATRAAYTLYGESGSPWPDRIASPVTFEGIFEIGPTDGEGNLDPRGTRWAVVLPMCDGDVRDLEGIGPFDRMSKVASEGTPSFKATLAVWGTNHNYYNTEWQTSESLGCAGAGNNPLFTIPPKRSAPVAGVTGSAQQQQIANTLATTFFRANVGAARDKALNAPFDPSTTLPTSLTSITRIDRGFLLAADTSLSTPFDTLTATLGSAAGAASTDVQNVVDILGTVPDHDTSFQAHNITWPSTPSAKFVQYNFAAPGSGIPMGDSWFFDFRVDRALDPANSAATTNFNVQLALSDGSLTSSTWVSAFLPSGGLAGPAGSRTASEPNRPHSEMQTVRIGKVSFALPINASVRGVRFNFMSNTSGSIYLADFRFTKSQSPDAGAGFAVEPTSVFDPSHLRSASLQRTGFRPTSASRTRRLAVPLTTSAGRIVSVGRAKAHPRFAPRLKDEIAIVVESDEEFPVEDSPIVLHIGDLDLLPSALSNAMDSRHLVFTLRPEEQARLRVGQEITATCGSAGWSFGQVTRAHLAH